MSKEQSDNEIPPFPTPNEESRHVPEKEEKKSGGSWLSLVVSLLLIISGATRLSEGGGMATWGMIMIAIGVGGGIWKIIDMNR